MRAVPFAVLLSLAWAQPAAVPVDPDLAKQLGAPVRAGDLRACSGEICVVVAAVDHAGVGTPTGGHVVSLGGQGRLPFGGLHLTLDEAGLRTPRFRKVHIAQPGSPTLPAIIRAEGTDPVDDQVEVVVDYILEPGSAVLRVVTSAANRGRGHYNAFALGFFVGWGRLEPFAPDSGTAITGRQTRSEWVGADHATGSVVVALHSGRLVGTHGQHWSVLSTGKSTLRPTDRVTRELEVYARPGTGLASAVDALRAARKSVSGRVEGTVKDGAAVALNAQITVYDARGRPEQRGTVRDGRYGFTLRPGDYQLVARAPGHAAGPPLRARINADETRKLNLELGPAGRLKVTIRDPDSPIPGWVRASTDHADHVFRSLDGTIDAPLAPGAYRLTIGAGPAHEVATRTVKVSGVTAIEQPLARAFSTAGWFAVDPNVGVEVGVAPPDTAAADPAYCAANGMQGSVLLRPRGAAPDPVAGYTVLVPEQGKFIGFPGARALPELPRGANAEAHLKALGGLHDKALVGVLAPRSPRIGYFARFRFDPAAPALPRGGFSLDFQLLDVGGFERAEAVSDYLGLLNRGAAVVPFAGSGAQTETDLCGSAFMWVQGAPPDAAGLRDAIARNTAVASNGPLIDLLVNDTPPGRVAPRREQNLVQVALRAAKWVGAGKVTVYADGRAVGSFPAGARQTLTVPAETRWVVAASEGNRDLSPITGRPGPAFAVTSPVFIQGP